ncbi:methyltransferase family protein [Pontibacter ummariensis]|uniref:Methyltransferase domain-containing protein n=1 Tax=Pontibacter ummariensis TaxID=1610492 RepID=A0A239FED7_9BACT|nr:class I SAM-dependent methyltransferase [Pontibacter ummariensis]PRY12296.1 methyltransferase family protein [Pontibacter ummariensis]SNS55177.1 Methyltransferase domain-containing protein [Pontibacter ummariensis]
MMEKNDPIGIAVLDYLQGAEDPRIVVESDLTEDDEMQVYYLFRKFKDMPELERIALEACQGTTLDVGAGAGCHSLALQGMGKEVTALDVSAGAIEAMQRQGVKRVLRQDVFELRNQQYDTLLMLMNGIGIAGNLQGLERFLRHAKSLLKPGGEILLESSDILYMYEEEDGSVLLDLNAGYYGEVRYNMKYKDQESGWFNWLFIDAAILEDYAVKHGYAFEVLQEGDAGNYLAKLTLLKTE